jgi:hypothetical protein
MSDETDAQHPEESVNPWAPWEEAGFTPDKYDPSDIRNAWDGWNALGDRDQRPYLIERMLQGNEIPDGMSLNELSEAANLYWQAKNDPFGNDDHMYSDPQQGYYSEDPSPEYGGIDPSYGATPSVDPNYLRSVWQQDVESIVEQRLAEMEQQYQERQQFDEFRTEMDRVRSENNLSDSDLQFIAPRAVEYVQPGQPVSNAVRQAFNEFDEWRRNSLASYAQQQGRAPQTQAPIGMPASPDQPPRSLAEAQAIMESRFSNG